MMHSQFKYSDYSFEYKKGQIPFGLFYIQAVTINEKSDTATPRF